MKWLFIISIFAFEFFGNVLSEFTIKDAIINNYIDSIMPMVGPWLMEGGLLPISMPDTQEGFQFRPLLITYSGKVELTKGVITKIDSAERKGDNTASYERQLLRVQFKAALKSMKFTWDYKTSVMELGIFEGKAEGYLEDIVFSFEIIVDMYDTYIFMQDFTLVSVGYVDVVLKGNILTDWLGNIMMDIITVLFKNSLMQNVSEKTRMFLQDEIDDINLNGIDSRPVFENILNDLMELLKDMAL